MVFYACSSGAGNLISLHDYGMNDRDPETWCKFTNIKQKELYVGQSWTPDATLGRTDSITWPPTLGYPDAPLAAWPDGPPYLEWPKYSAMPSDGGAYLTMLSDIPASQVSLIDTHVWPEDVAWLEPFEQSDALTGNPVRLCTSEYKLFDGCSSPKLSLRWIPQQFGGFNTVSVAGVELKLHFGSELVSITPTRATYGQMTIATLTLIDGGVLPDGYNPELTYSPDAAVHWTDGNVYYSTIEQCGNPPPGTGWMLENTAPTFIEDNDPSYFEYPMRLKINYTSVGGEVCEVVSKQFPMLKATQYYEDESDYNYYLTSNPQTISMEVQANNRIYCECTGDGLAGGVAIYIKHNEYPLSVCDWYGHFTILWPLGDDLVPANALSISLS